MKILRLFLYTFLLTSCGGLIREYSIAVTVAEIIAPATQTVSIRFEEDGQLIADLKDLKKVEYSYISQASKKIKISAQLSGEVLPVVTELVMDEPSSRVPYRVRYSVINGKLVVNCTTPNKSCNP